MPDPFAVTIWLVILAGVLASIARLEEPLEHEQEAERLEENWTWPTRS